jgi:hypothetical protein
MINTMTQFIKNPNIYFEFNISSRYYRCVLLVLLWLILFYNLLKFVTRWVSSFLVLMCIILRGYRELLAREYRETIQNEIDVYKEPLKIDGSSISSGLERSYSSPNLLQVRKILRIEYLPRLFFFYFLTTFTIATA